MGGSESDMGWERRLHERVVCGRKVRSLGLGRRDLVGGDYGSVIYQLAFLFLERGFAFSIRRFLVLAKRFSAIVGATKEAVDGDIDVGFEGRDDVFLVDEWIYFLGSRSGKREEEALIYVFQRERDVSCLMRNACLWLCLTL